MKKLGKKSLLGLLMISLGLASLSSIGYAAIFRPPKPQRDPEKIGVLIWSSEVGTQTIIDKYIRILEREGYTKFFEFEDCHIQSALASVDAYENSCDTIFFYLYGHGEYKNFQYIFYYDNGYGISSSYLKEKLDQLEATRKGLLIEACYSGGFVDEFSEEPYIVMSSADKEHKAQGTTQDPPGEGRFSLAFWIYVNVGKKDTTAFNLAKEYTSLYSNQNPQISDMSDYTFFAS